MTDEETIKIGQMCREAVDGNFLVGSFGAELVGESYPFSKAMRKIVFDSFSDIELGHKFVEWMDKSR